MCGLWALRPEACGSNAERQLSACTAERLCRSDEHNSVADPAPCLTHGLGHHDARVFHAVPPAFGARSLQRGQYNPAASETVKMTAQAFAITYNTQFHASTGAAPRRKPPIQ
jgi:hypothetical protein